MLIENRAEFGTFTVVLYCWGKTVPSWFTSVKRRETEMKKAAQTAARDKQQDENHKPWFVRDPAV